MIFVTSALVYQRISAAVCGDGTAIPCDAFVAVHPATGLYWQNSANSVHLGTTPMILTVDSRADGYRSADGFVALKDQATSLHITVRSDALSVDAFLSNTSTFAWDIQIQSANVLVKMESGLAIGYDADTDRVSFWAPNDARAVAWKFMPVCPSIYACYAPPAPNSNSDEVIMIAAISASAAVLLLVSGASILFSVRRKRKRPVNDMTPIPDSISVKSDVTSITLTDSSGTQTTHATTMYASVTASVHTLGSPFN
jgi:hypothetical protein